MADSISEVPGHGTPTVGIDAIRAWLESQVEPPSATASLLTSTSTVNGSSTSSDEVDRLLQLRVAIIELLRANEELQEAQLHAHTCLRAAIDEVEAYKVDLERIDGTARQGQRVAKQEIQEAPTIALPMFPNVFQGNHRLAFQAKEVDDLRTWLSHTPWTANETALLNQTVRRHCQRAWALQQAKSHTADPMTILDTLEGMDNSELLHLADPSKEADRDATAFDWTAVAFDMGGHRLPQDCRTHWWSTSCQSDPTRSLDWTDDQKEQLQRTINQHIDRDGPVRDWVEVAQRQDEDVSAWECFVAAQRFALIPPADSISADKWKQVGFARKEASTLQQLYEVWGDKPDLLARRLGTSRPAHALTTRLQQLRTQQQRHPAFWTPEADQALLQHLATTLQCRRTRLLREPFRVRRVDWSADFAHRPRHATDADIEQRWHFLLADVRVHPETYRDVLPDATKAGRDVVPPGRKRTRRDDSSTTEVRQQPRRSTRSTRFGR